MLLTAGGAAGRRTNSESVRCVDKMFLHFDESSDFLCEQTWCLISCWSGHNLVFSLKLPEEPHMKPGPPRHKQYGTPTRPTTPRTPKHRLSVDANLQIPDALNSASKKDLLRRVCRRHAHSAHPGSVS